LKKVIIASAVIIIALFAWLVSMKLERERRELKTILARRDAAHRTALAPYLHDLPLGMSRADVDRYLASKNMTHFTVWGDRATDGASYELSRSEEPGDGFACDRWYVSIGLEFKSSGGSRELALPSDILREIHTKQIGHCL
jgi:hypothetical protein